MEGTVVAYGDEIQIGAIVSDQGKRFVFSPNDWISQDIRPMVGMRVSFDFRVGSAINVRALTKTPVAS